jgi:antitoxin HigA-1
MLKRGMRPAHPGAILGGVIEGLREETGQALTVNEIAKGLGVHRATLSAVLNQRTGISVDMAIKLSEAFGTDADLWVNLQKKYDLWHAEKRVDRSNIQHFTPPRLVQPA